MGEGTRTNPRLRLPFPSELKGIWVARIHVGSSQPGPVLTVRQNYCTACTEPRIAMGRQSYALKPDRILWILAIIAGGRNTATLPTGPWHGYLGRVHAYTDGVRFITSLYHGVMHYTTAHIRNPVREASLRLIN